MIHITSCCWCLGLEAGSKIIGYLHLLVSLGLMVLYSVTAREAGLMMGTVEDAVDGLYSKVYYIAVSLAVFTVLHVTLAVILICSVHKRQVTGVRVWVWSMLFLLLLSLSYVLYSMTLGFTSSGSHIFLTFVEGTIFFCVLMYCILCVHSYSLLLRSFEDPVSCGTADYH
ncbi:uncharacterized protein LOC116770631 [Danaus plexippus]|uniref:uncharacterized protein LOC116770631 n=1 Tax=Danaus plexippus TaxID=13037 RepID=UPI002AB0D42C|nr:uncharacterized protein LOC116770631 [Danaus plexippus]XP_032518073.2 uncharacterized protein LOC116770631 [Danaus plexippus]XP_032518074.2 uncharacterized protein LOC116770631 [Danaus plexippus]XP_032518075.2 uncharacterized protein LOC116770631 [Danaus plexippus]